MCLWSDYDNWDDNVGWFLNRLPNVKFDSFHFTEMLLLHSLVETGIDKMRTTSPDISTYINTKMCLCVCVSVRVFLGHLGSDWDTLWYKCALMPRNGSKTIKFQKKFFPQSYCPLSVLLKIFSVNLNSDYTINQMR